METLLIINALLLLVEKLLPKLGELRDGGNITKEQQDEVRRRYDALKADMDGAFGGDHWKVRPDPESEAPGTVVKNKAKGDSTNSKD